MSAQVQLHLALILFLPWFAILGSLFWFYPRQPRTPSRRAFDVGAMVLAIIAFVVAIRWGHAIAQPTGTAGNIWRQVVATAATSSRHDALSKSAAKNRQCSSASNG